MNELQKFDFNGRPVSIIDRDGEAWFIAKDVCDVLEISKYRDAVARLDEDERGSVLVDTLGGSQEMAAINESGLYKLVFRSRKAVAQKFTKWVTAEVLPTIRKSGAYVSPALTTTESLIAALAPVIRENERLRAHAEFAKNFLPVGNPGELNKNGLPKNQYRRGYYVSGNGKSVSALIERMEQPGLFEEVELKQLGK